MRIIFGLFFSKRGAESVAMDVLDQFAGYFLTRAELLKKLIKYPGLSDFRNALVELDEKTYIKTAMVASDMRSLYLLLFDLLSKNLTTLLEAPLKSGNKEAQDRMFL